MLFFKADSTPSAGNDITRQSRQCRLSHTMPSGHGPPSNGHSQGCRQGNFGVSNSQYTQVSCQKTPTVSHQHARVRTHTHTHTWPAIRRLARILDFGVTFGERSVTHRGPRTPVTVHCAGRWLTCLGKCPDGLSGPQQSCKGGPGCPQPGWVSGVDVPATREVT